jgi:hypothetical protein
MSRHLTTASNELEAEIVISRLREAGIGAWESNNLGGRPGSAGARDIYVEDTSLERAQQILAAAQDFDEDELAELAQRARPAE